MNLSQMYKRVGLDYTKVKSVLINIGNTYCHSESKDRWSARNPTKGYCYKLCEVVSHLLKKKKIEHKVMQIKTSKSNHWFIKLSDNSIIELTSSKTMRYGLGKGKSFFPCPTKTRMSLGAEAIARDLKLL